MKTPSLFLALVASIALLAAPPVGAQVAGTLEAYNANVTGSAVMTTAVQPDGKMIIGGSFTTVGGAAHRNIARLHADGSVDASFNASADTAVYSVAVQADGKIVLGGDFVVVNGAARNRIARLNASGSVESTTTFSPVTGLNGSVNSVAVQADGKIVLGGNFTTIDGTARGGIARLNPNGSVESTVTFNPGTGANGLVYTVAVQADGKIVLGGTFTAVNGASRSRIARLLANGSVESTATFNPGTGPNGSVFGVAVQADGKIVLGGGFTAINFATRGYIARLHADGSVESTATFNPGTGASSVVHSVAVQADGKLVLGGQFTAINGSPRNRIARLHADGSLESTATFNPGSGASSDVYSVALQADGKIVLGGLFTSVNGTARIYIARLANDPATQTVGTPNATQALWSRGFTTSASWCTGSDNCLSGLGETSTGQLSAPSSIGSFAMSHCAAGTPRPGQDFT